MSASDGWYQELVLQFADGKSEVIYLDMSRSGRHRPRAGLPAEWTRLALHKCPCCTLTLDAYCPAAVSMEETLVALRERKGAEAVTATATDSESRSVCVQWSLQQVGAALVQIAVFCSGCPVGAIFRPLLRDLRPFSTGRELGKHLVAQILLRHRGDAAASAATVKSRIEPLRVVFEHLFKRLETVPRGAFADAIPNSIVHMHSLTLLLGTKIEELIAEIDRENR